MDKGIGVSNHKLKKVRCTFCNKKCNIINYTCNCGGIFCPKHRYTHTHNCSYIEKNKINEKLIIEKSNPKVGDTKVIKI